MGEPCIIPVGSEPEPMDRKRQQKSGRHPKRKKSSAGRFRCLNSFVDFTMSTLARAEIAVWLVLYRDTKDGVADTSMNDVAKRAGCTRRQVIRAIQKLQTVGLLKIVKRGGLNQGNSRYRISPLIP